MDTGLIRIPRDCTHGLLGSLLSGLHFGPCYRKKTCPRHLLTKNSCMSLMHETDDWSQIKQNLFQSAGAACNTLKGVVKQLECTVIKCKIFAAQVIELLMLQFSLESHIQFPRRSNLNITGSIEADGGFINCALSAKLSKWT